ncbi:MAG TPA: molybdopterin molybdotransferase MoeA, partial [Rhizomicrobium sp.]|nr:molybdopterin molybdotransferase MoeA [Rhizomicrobium sp.]
MLSVDEATQRIVAALTPLESERVPLEEACGRTLAADVPAGSDQPPFPSSVMDGYAVRSADHGARRVIGSAPAGHPFTGTLGPNEAVRLFTGSRVPDGADAVLAQEDARVTGDAVEFSEMPFPGKFIRAQGLDFRAGQTLVPGGTRLSARNLALLAAGDHPCVEVRRRPVIALASTGDELSLPGTERKPGGIVASSVYGLMPWIAQWGGLPHNLGILPDNSAAIAALADEKCDLLVTMGGASVGDHDLVRSALGAKGFALDFWKIAMRPGKPLIFGRLGMTPLLGLPGNPVSSLVCALLFLRPAIACMLGRDWKQPLRPARLIGALKANGERQDYLRAKGEWRDGVLWARAFPMQD